MITTCLDANLGISQLDELECTTYNTNEYNASVRVRTMYQLMYDTNVCSNNIYNSNCRKSQE